MRADTFSQSQLPTLFIIQYAIISQLIWRDILSKFIETDCHRQKTDACFSFWKVKEHGERISSSFIHFFSFFPPHQRTMAFTNFAGGENQTEAYEKLQCSSGLTERMNVHLIYISAFNILLSITASLGNALILIALHKESSLHPPSKLFLRCLASTDICIGLIAEPLGIIRWISMVKEDWNLCRYSLPSYFITGYTLSSVSLLTITAISVDRLLALVLGLKYRQVVTLKRTYVILATFCVVSTVAATSYLANDVITYWYGILMILSCMFTSIICYTKIFLILRHHQTQERGHGQRERPSQTISLNMARYKKAVSSAMWLQFALVVCYLPYGVMSALYSRGLSSSSFLPWQLAVTLVYLHSSLNPFLYCWKIPEVRQAVKNTTRQILCCSSS